MLAKGYSKKYGVDYTEVFVPVARMDTVRMIIALAAHKNWMISQLDVKSAFLHGELSEDDYVEQPKGYEKKGSEHLVYKLHKALEFDMTDLGKMRFFLGIEVLQKSDGIYICQRKYALKVLRKFGMMESNLVRSPIVPRFKISRNEDGNTVDETYYKQGGEGELLAFTDSDYAGDMEDRKSTSGYVFFMGSSVVSWCSKKQPIVTLSTTEAEFVAAAVCVCQGVWMKRILKELGHLDEGSNRRYNDQAIKARSVSKASEVIGIAHVSADVWQQIACIRFQDRVSSHQLLDLVCCFPLQQLGRLALFVWTFLCLPPPDSFLSSYSYYSTSSDDEDHHQYGHHHHQASSSSSSVDVEYYYHDSD
ncbi:hypothetical protein D5086_000037 [Populus alba]|uniref:Uncharacterized protein n=1 Tax=Populus alba TaxID=43335 RepID=A0ACC4CUP9_POPAL